MKAHWILFTVFTVAACGAPTSPSRSGGNPNNGATPDLAYNPMAHPQDQPDLSMDNGGGNPGPEDMAMAGGGGNLDLACHGPTNLHPPKMGMASVYCPFSGVNGGKPTYCQQGTQHCCEPSSGTAACNPIATPCAAGAMDWQCEDTTDCPMGNQCCAASVDTNNPNSVPR